MNTTTIKDRIKTNIINIAHLRAQLEAESTELIRNKGQLAEMEALNETTANEHQTGANRQSGNL